MSENKNKQKSNIKPLFEDMEYHEHNEKSYQKMKQAQDNQ